MKLPRFFKDKQGKVVIWQNPNLLLWIWIIGTILARVFDGETQEVCKTIAHAAIIAWAVLEIVLGASYFRRTLGLVVLIITLLPLFRN